jgi:predicted dehydrogenase
MKVGLIGCGGIAPVHIEVYKRLKDVEVVGLCDLNLDRAKKLATEFKIENTYTNYHNLFEKEKPDLVDICTPVSTHAQIVCDAAESIPAILLEKPMALNIAECDEIIKKVSKRGRKLCLGHSQLFSPHIQRAKRMVDSEGFNLHSFRTTLKASFEKLKSYRLAPAWNVSPEQRGIIWEVCCHHAYLQLHFLPDIKEVYAVGGKVTYPVYDDFAVILRTGRNSFGLIELSWISHEFEVTYELRDTTGRRVQINWEYDHMLEQSEDPPYTVGLVARNMLVDQKRLIQKWARFGSCFLYKRKLLPAFNLISSYIDSIENDYMPPVTPQDGRNTIKLLECIEASLDKKMPVSIS